MPNHERSIDKSTRASRRATKTADPGSQSRRAEAVSALVGGELKRQGAVLSLPSDNNDGLSAPRTHAMRIATRRARSALRTFRDELPDALVRLEPELKWLAGVLGAVRDLDVYADRYRRRYRELPPEDASVLGRYDAHLAGEHASARADLLAALASERCMTLLAAFDVLRDVPEHEAFAVSDTELREVGESHVNIVVKRVLKRGRRIDDASTATKLHDLRKEMKRVRYLLELVEPYLHGSAQRLRKAAARLQDVLGEHQDACAAEVRMRAYLDASPPEGSSVQEAFALGRLAEAERLAARKARKRVAKAWRSFEEAAGSRY